MEWTTILIVYSIVESTRTLRLTVIHEEIPLRVLFFIWFFWIYNTCTKIGMVFCFLFKRVMMHALCNFLCFDSTDDNVILFLHILKGLDFSQIQESCYPISPANLWCFLCFIPIPCLNRMMIFSCFWACITSILSRRFALVYVIIISHLNSHFRSTLNLPLLLTKLFLFSYRPKEYDQH